MLNTLQDAGAHPKKAKFTQILNEFIIGIDSLAPLTPCISVFGSSRVTIDSKYAKVAQELTTKLSNLGIHIITGGGPGVMAAANRGAKTGTGKSIGLNIELSHRSEPPNPYLDLALKFRYFFTRKATFLVHSCAFVVFPGGFGTLDEVMEVLTMLQTKKINPAPVIFVGTAFWQPMIDWLKAQPLKEGMIAPEYLNFFTLTDDLDEITNIITQTIKINGNHKNFYLDL